ncbi:MAG: CBS domain-containing protein [Thermodesulfobacteriota bacterium]
MQKAKEIMTATVVTVPPEMPVERLAALLHEKKISGAPVVDAAGQLLGVVTESDLIDQAKKIHIPTAITILDSVIFLESAKAVEREISKMTGATVADICSRNPVTIREETPLDEIATIMAERQLHTLPVLRGAQLVGVVGKSDVIKTLAR